MFSVLQTAWARHKAARRADLNRSARRRLAAAARQFGSDRSGIAAVEFAMVAPVLMILYFGITEIGDAVVVYTKVTHTASSVNDLVSQAKIVTNADMTNMFNAAATILAPYPTSALSIVVSAVQTDAASKATVAWSDGYHATPLAKNSAYTLPTNLVAPNAFYVDAKVTFQYQPIIGYLISGTVALTRETYLLPRNTSAIMRVP